MVFMSSHHISFLFHYLTTETEKYVNEDNFNVNLAPLKHSTGDHREREGTEQMFGPSLSLPSLDLSL